MNEQLDALEAQLKEVINWLWKDNQHAEDRQERQNGHNKEDIWNDWDEPYRGGELDVEIENEDGWYK